MCVGKVESIVARTHPVSNARFYQLTITRETRVIPGIRNSRVLCTPKKLTARVTLGYIWPGINHGITPERQKWPLRKASHRSQKWRSVSYVDLFPQRCPKLFWDRAKPLIYLDKLGLAHYLLCVQSGVIYTTRQLMFNANQPAVHLVVTATDYGSPVRQSTAITVQINIQDINDHTPEFTLAEYR